MRETERNDSFRCEEEGGEHWAAVWRCCRPEIEGENSCRRVKISIWVENRAELRMDLA